MRYRERGLRIGSRDPVRRARSPSFVAASDRVRPGPTPMSGRGVVDPRLVAYGRSTRRFLVVTVALGCVAAGLVIAQAWFIAVIVAGAVTSGDSLADRRRPVALLLVVVLLRAAVAWATEVAADRSSARVKSE